jgi:hypothetical protein
MTRDCEDAVNALRRTRRRNARLLWILPVVGAIGAGAVGGLATTARSASAPGPSEGLVCDDGVATPGAPAERVFVLTAKRGKIFTADGNQVPMWGFSSGSGAYQYPSPFLCAVEGDHVTVVLHNQLGNAGATPVRTSIMFPGQGDVTANGLPAQPELVNPANAAEGLVSLVPSVLPGKTITYAFTASKAGTYIYESGTSTAVQMQMGLFGGLIVRPAVGANGEHLLYAGHPGTRYDPRREVVHLLSDVDPALHMAVDAGKPHATDGFRPRYWFINGRGFPDTTAPNNADWLPNQPYGSSLHVLPLWNPAHHAAGPVPGGYDLLPAAVRYINASETAHPFHPHSADTLVHGIDGRPLESSNGADLTENHYSIELAPGQTADATWSWEYVGTHAANGAIQPFDPVTNPVPVPTQDFRDNRYTPATWASGTPYLGIQDDLPLGPTSLNECGEYYSVSHSHAVEEATTYGAAGGGMLTLYRIDPPGHEGCTP